MVARDGDGWIECSCGSKHWGLNGAAGLLIYRDGAIFLGMLFFFATAILGLAIPFGLEITGGFEITGGLSTTFGFTTTLAFGLATIFGFAATLAFGPDPLRASKIN